MQITKSHVSSLIKEELERLSYASKAQGYTYGIDHVEKDQNYEDIIGHT